MKQSLIRLNEFLKGNRFLYVSALAAVALAAFLGFIPPLLIRLTLDNLIGGKPLDQWNAIWVPWLGGLDYLKNHWWLVAVAMLLVTAFQGLFNYLKGRWSAVASENVACNLRERLYDHIQRLPYAYHVKAETGDLIQRCTSDLETIRRFLAVELVEVGRALFMIALVLPLMLSMSKVMTLVSMIVIPPLVVYSMAFFSKVRKAFKNADESEGALSAMLQENLSGIRVVKAFHRQEFEIDKFESRNCDYRDKAYSVIHLLAVFWGSTDFLSMVQVAVTLVFGTILAVKGQITVGTLVVFLSYVSSLLWPIRQMGRILTDFGKSIVSITRIGEILDTPTESYEPGAVAPLTGEIVFDHVSFGYDPEHPVLNDISFRAKPGQTIAILGATGSGKSTLISLLPRLYDYPAGSIRIDGQELRDLPRSSLRKQIGIVLQEPFLYARTVGENIGLGIEQPDEQSLHEAATIACLHDVVMGFEKGYDTVVGEKGVTLSGGQKQRAAIARAIMKKAPILIFDDALSAVDTETDARIRRALRKRRGHATTILISHRLTTLSEADWILVMEHGHITEAGRHDDLIARDGLYQRIWNIQNTLESEVRDEIDEKDFSLVQPNPDDATEEESALQPA